MEHAILAGAALVFAAAAYSDLRSRTIANVLVAALAALGLSRQLLCGSSAAVLGAALSIATLCVLLIPFQRGWLGGGDVKLLAAGCLLFAGKDAFAFLLATALAGGILSLVAVAEHRMTRHWGLSRPFAETAAPGLGAISLPYGLAIAAGAVWVIGASTVYG